MWKEDFTTYAICPCGHKREAPFGKLLHVHETHCPKCAEPKDSSMIKVIRKVHTGVWFKPWTWGDTHWEDMYGQKVKETSKV